MKIVLDWVVDLQTPANTLCKYVQRHLVDWLNKTLTIRYNTLRIRRAISSSQLANPTD
jgi:hypothetical protein